MKSAVLFLSLLATAATTALPALAETGHEGMNHAAMHATAGNYPMSEGIIKKVDRGTAKITISHGPLQNLGMPAMTMAFRVADAAMLDAAKPGDRVRFVAEDVGGALTVTRLQPAK